jgi:hypothetical protein
MSTAGVHSISALRDFKAILTTFGSEGGESLAVTEMAVRRGIEWFTSDLLKHWQKEVRKSEDAVTDARAELERCRMQSFGDRTPDCTDQKVALKKAQMRLEEAQRKVQAVKKWSRVLEEEAHEYRGQAQQLGDLLAGELPKAHAEMDRMLSALEAYLGLSAPAAGGETSMTNSAPSAGPAANPAANPPAAVSTGAGQSAGGPAAS